MSVLKWAPQPPAAGSREHCEEDQHFEHCTFLPQGGSFSMHAAEALHQEAGAGSGRPRVAGGWQEVWAGWANQRVQGAAEPGGQVPAGALLR